MNVFELIHRTTPVHIIIYNNNNPLATYPSKWTHLATGLEKPSHGTVVCLTTTYWTLPRRHRDRNEWVYTDAEANEFTVFDGGLLSRRCVCLSVRLGRVVWVGREGQAGTSTNRMIAQSYV